MKEVKPRRNTPIAQLIKNYRNKKSGKVSAARNEIQWRFDALDWRHQKQILPDFLRSGKGDRGNTWGLERFYVANQIIGSFFSIV